MAKCKNCGKPQIVSNGKCIYCGKVLDGNSSNNMDNYNEKLQVKKQQKRVNNNTSKLLYQILLFLILFAVIIPVSIAECETKNGLWWGFATIYLVNGAVILWSIITIVNSARGLFSNKEKTWRRYYEWVHFPIEIIFVLIGYWVLYNYEETWVLLLNFLNGSWPIVGARCMEETFG